MNVLIYRSKEASFAAKRIAAAMPGHLRTAQQDHYKPKQGDTAITRLDCYEELADTVDDWNPAHAVQGARDKIVARAMLGDLSPDTWTDLNVVRVPCVIRPRRHKAGVHFYVARSPADVRKFTAKLRRLRRGWYATQLIDKAREFRVFVVQGRVAAVSERLVGASKTLAWNLAMGGRLINVNRADWPIEILRPSIEACNRIGLGFGAVDVTIDKAGRVYVFEVNTSPALRNKFTIKQIARALAWTGKVNDIKEGAKKASSYQHPALRKE